MQRWIVLTTALFLILIQTALMPMARAAVATEDEGGSAGAGITGDVNALKRIRTESLETTVPAAAIPLIKSLKHRLLQLISHVLNSYGGTLGNANDMRELIVIDLKKRGVTLYAPKAEDSGDSEPENVYTYGEILGINLERVVDHNDLIAATVSIGVCCGDDTSFYLFRKIDTRWELIMAQEAGEYNEVSGAQGRLHYAVSPTSGPDGFFVVTTSVTPWCTSNWQRIRYRVLREGPDPYQPKVLLDREESIYLGNENDGVTSVEPNAFRVDFESTQWLDMGELTRNHTAAYRVEGDRVTRIPPLASAPEGFIDEWIDLPWEEAQKWIAAPDPDRLQEWHKTLRTDRRRDDREFYTSFLFAPPSCEIFGGFWEIGIGFGPFNEGKPLPSGVPKEAYFTVVEKDEAYYLQGVSEKSADPKCGQTRPSAENEGAESVKE